MESPPVSAAAKNPINIVVLEIGMHCDGCASQIEVSARAINGVENVIVDKDSNKLIVVGELDPIQIRNDLSQKIKKTVNIVSVQSNNCNTTAVADNNSDEHWPDIEKKDTDIAIVTINKESHEKKPNETPATMAVFKVPLHCDGCIRKIGKIIRRIRGVQGVSISKEEETVTVKATIDVQTLTDTVRTRLKKFVGGRQIVVVEVVEDKSQFRKQDHKQEISPQPTLQLSQQQQQTEICAITIDLNEGGNQSQRLVGHEKPNSETRGSSPTSEIAAWAFLTTSLILEVVSCVLDQQGYLFASMLLSFPALLLSTAEMVHMARIEGLITLERSRSTYYCCHLTYNSPPSELFMVIHFFGFSFAVWQCLNSTVQYMYSLRNLDNPIKMSLIPVIFLLCVLFSKIIRKMEEINCQDMNKARDKLQSDLSLGLEHIGQDSERTETRIDVPSNSMELVHDPLEFRCGDFGCSHYRRRCKIRAPCCHDIFDCWQCHNEAKNAVETSPGNRQPCRHQEVIKVICCLCRTEQDVHQNCIRCGVCMGKYFCAKCKLFDDDVSKNQYHCDECGICRNGGRENFFHCKKCGSCFPKLNDEAHHCMENEMHQD